MTARESSSNGLPSDDRCLKEYILTWKAVDSKEAFLDKQSGRRSNLREEKWR